MKSTSKPTCPSCGAEVPPDAPCGYCLKCLFALGTAEPDSVAGATSPLLVTITTPFIRQFRWRRLLWTYLLPLVPLACWWDGIVSQLRAYSPAELQDLAEAVGAHTYCWRAGRVPIISNPGCLTNLIGYPDETERNCAFGFGEHRRQAVALPL